MEILLSMFIFPFLWTLFFVLKYPKKYNWKEGIASIAITIVICSGLWAGGTFSAAFDTEIINGKITHKERKHDTYLRSYSCNCRSSCSGKPVSCRTICSTCYERRYTVEWYANSTVGRFVFDSKDSSSTSVYSSRDPQAYVNCKVGEPAATTHIYTNYIKAVPDSLFNTELKTTMTVPPYPEIHSFYKVQRVINVDSLVDQKEIVSLNDTLSEALIDLGSQRQVNLIVILTENDDPEYRHAVENTWLGGKKNDVIVFIGLNGNQITWTDVMTWALNSGNEYLHVTLKDRLTQVGQFNTMALSKAIIEEVGAKYDRPRMEDYEYLKDDIQPPVWMIVLGFILSVVSTIGLSYYFYHNETF